MNLISIVQQLPKEDIETIQGYVEMIEEENQELKKQYENAVADYETTMAEKVELERQLENNSKINIADHKYASECEDKVIVLKTQQKKFIKYLEDEIKQNIPNARWKHYNEDGFNDYDVENPNFIEVQPTDKVLKQILQKYKEIIGDDKE